MKCFDYSSHCFGIFFLLSNYKKVFSLNMKSFKKEFVPVVVNGFGSLINKLPIDKKTSRLLNELIISCRFKCKKPHTSNQSQLKLTCNR